MSDYIVALPAGAKMIHAKLASFERSGNDGNEVIVPLMGGDQFVGEVLSGKWKKDSDGNILSNTIILSSGHVELTAKSHSAGNFDYHWIVSNSQILIRDNLELKVAFQVPSSVTASRAVGVELDLIAQYPVGDDPQYEDDWLKIQLQNDNGTYQYKIRKSVAGTETDVKGWTSVTNRNVVFKLVFNEQKNGETSIYIDDGETGTFDEVNDSPFSLGLDFDVAYMVVCQETSDATSRTVDCDYIDVTYPQSVNVPELIKYEVPRGDRAGTELLYAEAEDCTLGGGADKENLVDDVNWSARLNAQDEYVSYDLNPVTDFLSKGRYLALIRIKDTAQVADDVELRAYNVTDSTFMNVEDVAVTKTVEGTFKIIQLVFDVDSEDVGDSCYLRVTKAEADANVIYVDWFRIIPYDGLNGRIRVYDSMGSADEDSWKECFDPDHVFVGDCIIQNGQLRFVVEDGAQHGFDLYWWDGIEWTLIADIIKFYLNSSATSLDYPYFLGIKKLNSDKIVFAVEFHEDANRDYDHYIVAYFTLERGKLSVKCEVTKVYPPQEWQVAYIENYGSNYHFAYSGDENVGDNDLSVSGNNATMTDNFVMTFDEDADAPKGLLWCCFADQPHDEFYGYLGRAIGGHDFYMTDLPVTLFFGFTPFSRTVSLFAEAEDETLAGGADTEDLADDSGESARLNAQNESVTWTLNPINNKLPEGRYLVLFRIKDTNQVANDVGLRVYNDTDGTYLNEENAEATKTVTADYAYYQLVFDVNEDDSGDSVSFRAKKLLADANVIYIDYFLVVPVGNGESYVGDLAHNALRKVGSQRRIVDRRETV